MKSLLVLCALAGPAAADTVTGVVVDGARQPIAGVSVRVIGDAFVVVTRTDRGGYFRVANLPAGAYRVVPDRGDLRGDAGEPRRPSAPLRIDREYVRCCLCAMNPRTFGQILGVPAGVPRPVDTRSTAQGITLRRPGW